MILVAIAISLTIYIFSVGPVMWLNNHGRLSPAMLERALVIYAPLDWLAHKSEAANRVLFWYAEFWQ
jgi:hypothetical protein